MLTLRDPLGKDEPPPGSVLSIGNFDGVHLGHQAVLRHVVEQARALGTTAAAMTFDPHPFTVLRPAQAPPLLTTLAQRLQLIARTGVDVVLVVPFTPTLAAMSALDFIRTVLVDRLRVREVYIGRNFRFGVGRSGDVDLLVRAGSELGFAAAAAPTVEVDGSVVSSSRVRAALAVGRVGEARAMLGRAPFVDGEVTVGKRFGRRLGFPTLNIDVGSELMPVNGVYVTAVFIPSFGRPFPSVTNIGVRPTIYTNSGTTVESHLLDFTADVYREGVRLFFLEHLREERLFPSPAQLMAQIRRDVGTARAWFQARAGQSLDLVAP